MSRRFGPSRAEEHLGVQHQCLGAREVLRPIGAAASVEQVGRLKEHQQLLALEGRFAGPAKQVVQISPRVGHRPGIEGRGHIAHAVVALVGAEQILHAGHQGVTARTDRLACARFPSHRVKREAQKPKHSCVQVVSLVRQ